LHLTINAALFTVLVAIVMISADGLKSDVKI
jgi:hypothetical protein